MGTVCQIGLDIAKNVFQAHGIDQHGKTIFSKKLARGSVLRFFANLTPCLIGIEACGGAHYWAREISKLDTGHTVKLIPPKHVKPFVINNKTDAADARAICEVVGRHEMHFVPIKTTDQQDILAWHRIRSRNVKERTALVNQIRGLMLENGIVVPQGITKIRNQLPIIIEDLNNKLSASSRDYLSDLYSELCQYDERINKYEIRIRQFVKTNEIFKKLEKIPGIGFLTATALVGHFGKAQNFKNGRALAACLGLTPREHSSGGKQKLLGISKRGNIYIRSLLIQGARNVVRSGLQKLNEQSTGQIKWLSDIVIRRGHNKASVALANKMARVAWHIMSSGVEYRATTA